jgi:hypothetical protein
LRDPSRGVHWDTSWIWCQFNAFMFHDCRFVISLVFGFLFG